MVAEMNARLEELLSILQDLNEAQLTEIEKVARQFTAPYIKLERLNTSEIVNNCLLINFGDALRLHHCFTREPLTKGRFEFALENTVGLKLTLPHRRRAMTSQSMTLDIRLRRKLIRL